MIPLQDTILYSQISYPNRYWTFERNTTEWNLFMTELTTAGNALAQLMLEKLSETLHGAHIGEEENCGTCVVAVYTVYVGLFDSHALVSDIISNPTNYLNGTATPNVITPLKSCIFQINESVSDTGNCTIVNGTDRDSYLWLVMIFALFPISDL